MERREGARSRDTARDRKERKAEQEFGPPHHLSAMPPTATTHEGGRGSDCSGPTSNGPTSKYGRLVVDRGIEALPLKIKVRAITHSATDRGSLRKAFPARF